jgi:hypothetical protein
VAAQALQRDQHAAVIRVEALRACQRRRAGELAEQLAVARAAHVDLVEEGGDGRVVATE